MSEIVELCPSAKYQTQLWAHIANIFIFLILPFALLGLIPELGMLYVLIFLLVNAAWLVAAIFLVPAYCRTVRYQLTDQDLIVQRGLFVHSEDVVPYAMITNVAIKRGPIERRLGLATLHIHTAGYSQQTGAEATIVGLEEWEQVHAQMLERIHRLQKEGASMVPALSGAAAPLEAANEVSVLLGEILAELRQLRADLRQRD